MRTVDCSYAISEERLREFAKVPPLERLRWLDELVRFTLMWWAAPLVTSSNSPPQQATDPAEAG